MGVKHFFQWFRKNHSNSVITIPHMKYTHEHISVDVLALDLNGIFHPVAQKVFEYGEHKQLARLLGKKHENTNKNKEMYRRVCMLIDNIVDAVQPKKKLFLCVDGVAGAAKMAQQRQRRFKSAKENAENKDMTFDPNCMTPGTQFMDHLTTYIYYHIHKRMQSHKNWKHLDVLFSNEKVPGEGEAKAMTYLRSECTEDESFCIYGLDADLIMLCMASMRKKMYILRENTYKKGEHYILDIEQFSKNITTRMKTPSAVIDFVFICFMVGNDFLPQIPTLEIFNDGIDVLLDIYAQTCLPFGLLTKNDCNIRINTFQKFVREMSRMEKDILMNKYEKITQYFPDKLFTKHFHYNSITDSTDFDLDEYQKQFYSHKLSGVNVNVVCKEYIKGMQWVIHYYTKGMPNWSWSYPYHYGPFLKDICECVDYEFKEYPRTNPYDPFQQLLCVLPPASASLIPKPLDDLLTNEYSPLKMYYPDVFEEDQSGKRQKWESVVLLPFINMRDIQSTYQDTMKFVSFKDKKRNRRVQPQIFRFDESREFDFKNYYGNIDHCNVISGRTK